MCGFLPQGLRNVINVGKQVVGALNPAIGAVITAVDTANRMFEKPDPPAQAAAPGPVQPAQAPEFKPTRPDALTMPSSLAGDFASFSPEQQRSSLATKGLNQGLGSEEDAYYRNLTQRSLIGDGNSVQAGSPEQYLLPIESQYFSHKGLNTSDMSKFLQGLSG